jgi:hypothetical protein
MRAAFCAALRRHGRFCRRKGLFRRYSTPLGGTCMFVMVRNGPKQPRKQGWPIRSKAVSRRFGHQVHRIPRRVACVVFKAPHFRCRYRELGARRMRGIWRH